MDVHRDFLDPARGSAGLRLAGREAAAAPGSSLRLPFFVANLALFWLLLTLKVAPVAVARVFFVWVSVFSLFAVAVFWSFMADLFNSEQAKRLFGFIGAGGAAGSSSARSSPSAFGSARPRQPADRRHRVPGACGVLRPPARARGQMRSKVRVGPSRVGGSAFAGFSDFFASPYLLASARG